jgi:hypothetical protein
MQAFFSLMIGSWQTGLLLGVKAPPNKREIDAQVDLAVEAVRRIIGR